MMLFCVGKTSGTNPSEMQGLEALIMTHAIQGRSSGSQLIKKNPQWILLPVSSKMVIAFTGHLYYGKL